MMIWSTTGTAKEIRLEKDKPFTPPELGVFVPDMTYRDYVYKAETFEEASRDYVRMKETYDRMKENSDEGPFWGFLPSYYYFATGFVLGVLFTNEVHK